uniref:Gag1-like clamp domain-containing protein n=1 Tax=Opuntia streptacantha TaxID=393608 RepID=A0A7C9CVL2_OPUST
MHGSRGCFACFRKPQLIIAVDEPSQGLKIQGRVVKKPSLSEDFWSTSTYEMENSTIQSQRSISSISMSNQNADPHSSTGSTSNPSEFINHGLLLWNEIRQQWVGDRKTHDLPKTHEPRLSWNATYENLLGTNKPFPQPIPLPEMVEFLVDVWEQEGLYD